MRVAMFVVVLVIHTALFLLFAALRTPAGRPVAAQVASIAFFVEPRRASAATAEPTRSRRTPIPRATASPQRRPPQPTESTAITPSPPFPPDWRNELQIAANSQLAREERKRDQPSPLAPHDFSGVKPGSTADSRHEFGWNHAATHRVEAIPAGGVLININDRCAIAWLIFPVPVCRIGKIPVRGDLFEHLKDAPEARP